MKDRLKQYGFLLPLAALLAGAAVWGLYFTHQYDREQGLNVSDAITTLDLAHQRVGITSRDAPGQPSHQQPHRQLSQHSERQHRLNHLGNADVTWQARRTIYLSRVRSIRRRRGHSQPSPGAQLPPGRSNSRGAILSRDF